MNMTGIPRLTDEQYAEATRRKKCLCDPDCPTCGGVGFVQYGDGKNKMCPTLFRQRLPENVHRYGITRSELETLNWQKVKNFNTAPTAASRVKAALERGYGMLYLWGDYGLAKTLILKIAVVSALNTGKEAAYANMAAILEKLKEAYNNADDNAQYKLDWWQAVRVLAIDELDRIHKTEWAETKRFSLLDERYTQAIREETLTIVASNTAPEKHDSYLFDRLNDGRCEIIHLVGASARPGMKQGNKF